MTNLLAAVTLLFFTFRGFRKGFVGALLALAGLVLGYVASILLYRPIGEILIVQGMTRGIFAFALGGVLAFFLVQFLLGVPAWVFQRWLKRKSQETKIPFSYWFFGGLMGALMGIFYAFVIVWAAMLFRAAKGNEVATREPSVSENLTSNAVSFIAQRVLQNRRQQQDLSKEQLREREMVDQMVVRLVSRPAQGVPSLRKIVENPTLEALFKSEDFQNTLVKGDQSTLESHPAFVKLFQDEDFMKSARNLGMVSENVKPEQLQKDLSIALMEVRARLFRIIHDPKAKAILEKPEIQKHLQEKNIYALLQNRDFNEFMDLVLKKPIKGEKYSTYLSGENWQAYACGPGTISDVNTWLNFSEHFEEGLTEALERVKRSLFCFHQGQELQVDDVTSLAKLADLGHASAQFRLAMKYANGSGVELDKEKALEWLRKATEKGDAEALFHGAGMNALGWLGKSDLKEAAQNLEKSAAEGFAQAEYVLGIAYATEKKENPQTILDVYPQMLDQSLAYLEKAALKKDQQAQVVLAIFHAGHDVFEKDLVKTHGYLKLAEEGGVFIHPFVWKEVLGQMSGVQLTQAKALLTQLQAAK